MSIIKEKSTTRKKRAQVTKDKLFKTAIQLFSAHSYDKVTVEDITTIAGVSKGTFYTYFPTKDAIILEVFNSIDEIYAELDQSFEENTKATDKLKLMMDSMAEYCSELIGLSFMKIVYSNQVSASESPLLSSNSRNFYKYVKKYITESIEQGLISGDAEILTKLLTGSARGLVYNWCLYNGSYSLKEETGLYMDILIDSLIAKRKLDG